MSNNHIYTVPVLSWCSDSHPPAVPHLTMPAPIIAGAIPVGKIAATVGLSAAGGVASYYIIDSVRGNDQPMINHALLTTASETKNDSLLAVSFGGAESGLVLVIILVVAAFLT